MEGLVDSHCHLQDPAFDVDRNEVLARAAAAGIERLLVPGYDLPSSRAAVDLARRHAAITAAVGIHPHFAAEASMADWDELTDLAGLSEVGAVGEIGLDYFRNLSPPDVQREAFARQLALAEASGKPVVVHDRDAHDDVRATLLGWPGPGRAVRGVLHAFSGDASLAREMTAAGFLVSFALPLTFGSAKGPRAAAAELAAGTFLVETDSPWLAPQGAGARNEPTTVLRVVVELARLRSEAPEDIAGEIGRTFDRLVSA
ncbi:MAG TPA: TatD family hydrolase [Candidatus Limnocylindrales bacterium]|nr:TatD family hydrolase [Candidatus Limnocylindrales bacterium]